MNKAYLLVICLLLAPFTGCIEDSDLELVEDTDEPDNTEEEKSENEEKTEERPTEQWTFYRDFVECDPNNDSIVAYGEFVDCLNMDLVNDGESMVAASSEFANEMFSMADSDMDGNLTSSEFDYIKNYPHEAEEGCMDMNATNYNSTVVVDDGSCEYPVVGCELVPYGYCYDGDLSGQDLSEMDLTGINLGYANLTDANLSGAWLYNADLTGADFTDAIVTDANFTDTYWYQTIWTDGVAYDENQAITEEEPVEGCMDSDATNYDSTANIDDGSCEYVCELVPYGHCSGEDLNGQYLSELNLTEIDLSYANLSGAKLRSANLSGANLSYADLTNANLEYAYLGKANLTNANLYEANLEWADLGNADLQNTNLAGANLGKTDLTGVNLGKANLTDANLEYADLTDANLDWANLTYANLDEAKLTGANLEYADFTDAFVTTAYFANTYWYQTIWTDGVAYDENQA